MALYGCCHSKHGYNCKSYLKATQPRNGPCKRAGLGNPPTPFLSPGITPHLWVDTVVINSIACSYQTMSIPNTMPCEIERGGSQYITCGQTGISGWGWGWGWGWGIAQHKHVTRMRALIASHSELFHGPIGDKVRLWGYDL